MIAVGVHDHICCNPIHAEAQVQVEVRTIADIEKDYSLVRTKLSLVRREPTMATLIHSKILVHNYVHEYPSVEDFL